MMELPCANKTSSTLSPAQELLRELEGKHKDFYDKKEHCRIIGETVCFLGVDEDTATKLAIANFIT